MRGLPAGHPLVRRGAAAHRGAAGSPNLSVYWISCMVGRIFLGRYEAIRLLGEGGMGRVYLARQLDLGRQVVVKVMHDHVANDPLFCERFPLEALAEERVVGDV